MQQWDGGLLRAWRSLGAAMGPLQSFQLAFLTACITIAWTETILYFRHRQSLALASSGGGHDEELSVKVVYNGVIPKLDLNECVANACTELSREPRVKVSAVTVDLGPSLEDPLDIAESFAKQASVDIKGSSSPVLTLGMGIVERKTEKFVQYFIAVRSNDSSDQQGIAVSIGTPMQAFEKRDLTDAIRRAIKQLMES